MVKHHVSFQTEGKQRVILVHGICFANYSVADPAFQIESDLVEMIRPHYKRVEDEGRTLVPSIMQDAADIEPAEGEIRITLAPLSSPHRSRVVESLCEALNQTNTMFPGTQLQMRYAVANPRS